MQELLAEDRNIYPEGLGIGYFGSLTAKAVRNFLKKDDISQVGVVGSLTQLKLNDLYAGKFGKVLPEQAKKVANTTYSVDDGNDADIATTSVALTSATITWNTDENSDSTVWFSMTTPVDTVSGFVSK